MYITLVFNCCFKFN